MSAAPSPALPAVDADRIAAHALWTELHTRVASRPLAYSSGSEAGAIKSLFALSQLVRQEIARNPSAKQFRPLALRAMELLTQHLSVWHPRCDNSGNLRLQKDRHAYRRDLSKLQVEMQQLTAALYQLAHDDTPPGHARPLEIGRSSVPAATLDTLGSGPSDRNADSASAGGLPPPWIDAQTVMAEEQAALKLQSGQATGLAISGGGIRSATFALGIIQRLQQAGLMQSFDYLSTVSGGGYLGGYLSGGITREANRLQHEQDPPQSTALAGDGTQAPNDAVAAEARERVYQGFGLPERLWVRWLRNNSKYLLNVPMRILRIGAFLLYGLFENSLTLVGVAMMAGLAVSVISLWPNLPHVPTLLGLGVLIYVGARPFLPPSVRRVLKLDLLATLTGALALLICTALVVDYVARVGDDFAASGYGLGALSGLLASAVTATQVFPSLGRFLAPKLLSLATLILGPLVFLLVAILTHGLATNHILPWGPIAPAMERIPIPISLFLTSLTGAILFRALFVDVNRGGLRSYYRNRLRSCFGIAPFDPYSSDEVPLSTLPDKPLHIINMALNAPVSPDPELRGRGCDFFAATKFHVGSRLSGYLRTSELERRDPDFDLATAVATSGAAASSLMGRKSATKFQFLMTLFNIRLGYWLRWRTQHQLIRPNAFHLIREALGNVHCDGNFVNLSDGGHIENLAVYELLRRRVPYIVCIDGGCEPDMACVDLIRLDRYARIDLNTALHYELDDLTPNAEGFCPSYGTMVRIEYPDRQTGWMLYLKLAMTGAEPQVIQDYRNSHPTFPHETTADQLFDEEQFEAYRLLGEVAASHFFDSAFGVDAERCTNLPNWVETLSNALSQGHR